MERCKNMDLNNFSIEFSLYSFFEDNSAMISYATTLHLTISCHRLCHEMPMPLTYCHFDLASDIQCFSHSHTQLYVTEHEKTGLMYTKYISLYYGTYFRYCLRY